jgi:hypothetical protein
MDYSVTELAAQQIDNEGNSTIKEESEKPLPPSSDPPLDQKLDRARKKKVKQAELKSGLQLALTYFGPGIIEELQDSPHLPNNVNGILEIAQRTHTEPIDVVQQSLKYIRDAANHSAVLARINQIVSYSPANFPTEFMKTKFAKQAIHDKPEFLSSAIGFDNAYPEHREQKYDGDSGWHTWMI